MAEIPVPSIATATPTSSDTVLGVQGGVVKRFAVGALGPFVNVKDPAYGAVGDGVTDDTDAINAAAAYASSSGIELLIQETSSFYLISDTVDFTNVKRISGGGELRGTFGGSPACIIGGSATTFRNADIEIKVRNASDESVVAGTYGIKLLNASNSRFKVYARGFNVGLYFDGASGSDRVWVDNKFDVTEFYNNSSHVHFDMAGNSYAVKGQFIGGTYYLGTGQTSAARGTFKLSLAGASLVSDILVQSPEIGINGSSVLSDHGVFVYATVATTLTINTIELKDVRFEAYGTYAADPLAVNIAANTSGRLGVAVELGGSMSTESTNNTFPVSVPESTSNKIRIANLGIRAQGTNGYPQIINPAPVLPYQVSGRCYVPGRVIFDQTTGYNVPVDYFSTGFGSNSTSRAVGDGDIVCSATTDTFGLMYTKGTTQSLFIELHRSEQFAIVCFDASGNVLSGTAPYYVQGEQLVSRTRGSVSLYELSGRWVWIHKDVSFFYIGGARWASPGRLRDIAFTVLFGGAITRKNDVRMSPQNMVANTSPKQCYLPLGASLDGAASNGWRNTFYLRTTTSASATAAATSIDVADAAGITAGDTIGIELNTEIATGARRYQHTTVSSVAGTTVNLGAGLAADVAASRAVLVNRWVSR